jgi:DNA-binding winged helix-turn-helix (wHTH) protein/TolB-like protein/Flp pilus assembly protein TadD
MDKASQQNISFAEFELDTARRRLLRNGAPLTLFAKTYELLEFLLENNGRVVSKDQILKAVWKGQFVEEANLSVQISALRKALGEKVSTPRFLVTVPGKGYKFVADLNTGHDLDKIVIEKQKLTHFVVESEVEIQESDSLSLNADANCVLTPTHVLPEPRRNRIGFVLALFGLAIVLTLSIVFLWPRLYTASSGKSQPHATIKSVAVLPFKPLVAGEGNESLEMGMADTLIAKLSNFKEINVRPISAVRKYADIEQDAVAAGREQKVDVVLDGQIQEVNEKIRVTVRLIRVDDGVTLWASQFDEKMTDIFAVQDSISERVAGALTLKLSGAEREQLTKRQTENTEAYRLYLLGRFHVNRLTDDGFEKGREYFQEAIDKDPDYAMAYAGLADAYNRLSGFNARSPEEGFPRAKAAALKALELDDKLAEAHTTLGTTELLYDWDWPAAEKEFDSAIEINPSNSDAHQQYGYYLMILGRFDDALGEMRRAQELDPLSLEKVASVGDVLYYERQYDQAIDQYQKALGMDPNSGFAHWALGNAYVNKGMIADAIAEYQKSIPLSGDSPDEPGSLACAYALSGNRRAAQAVIDDLKERSKRRYISPTIIAFIYSRLGDKDQAFMWLNKAYDGKDFLLVYLKIDPMFDPLRSDPRFAELIQRVRLPQ